MLDDVTKWFEQNKRELPWRSTTPWGVMVSEFMLQQTPVSRVLPKWNEWIERWPEPRALAEADKSEVIKAWGRLGYPRRALRLWESANVITSEFSNQVPQDVETLQTLPGVGDYTAKAIATFAYGQSHNVMDINIRRVFARLLDGQEHPKLSADKRERQERPVFGPTWSAAVMELGALICTAKNPSCQQCPLATSCLWLRNGRPTSGKTRKSQSWVGTKRQCRGAVLQKLRESDRPLLQEEFNWQEKSQLEIALAELIEEGFITSSNYRYSLAK